MLLLALAFPLLVLSLSLPQKSWMHQTDISIRIEEFPAESERANEPFHVEAFKNPQLDGLNYDAATEQWSGYIDMPVANTNARKHMFFWMLLSQTDPATAPVILWLNGGPGASSMYGLLTQWGSKIITDEGTLKKNEAALNKNATIIFLDQPGGGYDAPTLINSVGFTYFDRGVPDTGNTAAAAQDVYQFLDMFRGQQFGNWRWGVQNLHIAGESYAGHYIPAIGAHILRQGPNWLANFKSIMIGNPWIDALIQQPSNFLLVCEDEFKTPARYRLDAATCQTWNASISGCLDAIEACRRDANSCDHYVDNACNTISFGAWWKLKNLDFYDMSTPRKYVPPVDGQNPPPRNKQEVRLAEWMNDEAKKNALGAFPALRWQLLNWRLNGIWKNEWWRTQRPNLDFILTDRNNDVRVLLYAGDTDFVCNWIGVKEVAKRIEWPGRLDFNHEASVGPAGEKGYRRLLGANGDQYGSFFSFSRLTFARVYGAGHMINENQPENAKRMFYEWIFSGGLQGAAPKKPSLAEEQEIVALDVEAGSGEL